MGEEVIITYETLYDVLRQERDKESLQKLDPTFYSDVQNYLQEKKQILAAQQQQGMFMDERLQKEHHQLMNIHKIVNEIFEKREHKIILLARDDVRTEGALIDKSRLLDEEKDFYEQIRSIFKSNREEILKPLFSSEQKDLKKEEVHDKKKVRFQTHVESFVGPDMETTYGPYAEGEVHELPEDVAEVLLRQEKVQED